MSILRPLISGFLTSAERFPERPAIAIQDVEWSYADLHQRASDLAHTVSENVDGTQPKLIGVFGHRSVAALSGVVGALLGGSGYVPLNPTFPAERTQQMITRAALNCIIAEQASLPGLLEILATIDSPITVIVPDLLTVDEIELDALGCGQHRLFAQSDLSSCGLVSLTAVNDDQLAYLLFTSGSTGIPKGVEVTQSNVNAFVDVMVDRYQITEHDRFSQTFDLTFDLSAFDMFVAWERGACVCVPTQGEKILPAKYVQSQQISIWFSVPSTAIMMKKLRMLKPDAFPSIRYSLFCGEALPLEVTEVFQRAASQSVVENLYGPTELTIACTLYRYDANVTPSECTQGVVPIGTPYPGMTAIVVDDNLAEVAPGEAGELLMTGPQLTLGYWEDAEKTAATFVVPPNKQDVFYRTGDRVRQDHQGGPLLFLGRIDNQIKVQGYRVELGEIEALVRQAAETDVAIAAGFPQGINGADEVIVFMSQSKVEDANIHKQLATELPGYMQPRKLIIVEDFPLNANGKIDRKALMIAHADQV